MNQKIHLGSRLYAAPADILNLEARENYTFIRFIDGKKILSSTTLGIIEKRLSDYNFFRVNRSTVINLDFLDEFKVHYYKSKTTTKATNKPKDIFISRRRIAAFVAYVNA